MLLGGYDLVTEPSVKPFLGTNAGSITKIKQTVKQQ